MIGMVRALIADPELPKKARAGRVDEIRMCVGMSECHAIGPHRVPVTCAVNAAAACGGRNGDNAGGRAEDRRHRRCWPRWYGSGACALLCVVITCILLTRIADIGGTPAVLAPDPIGANPTRPRCLLRDATAAAGHRVHAGQ